MSDEIIRIIADQMRDPKLEQRRTELGSELSELEAALQIDKEHKTIHLQFNRSVELITMDASEATAFANALLHGVIEIL